MKNKSRVLLSIAVLSSFLVACGGGANSSSGGTFDVSLPSSSSLASSEAVSSDVSSEASTSPSSNNASSSNEEASSSIGASSASSLDSSSSESSSYSSSDSSSYSSEPSSSSSQGGDGFEYDSTYYPSVNPNLYGESFLTALRSDVLKLYKVVASYDDCKSILTKSDANPDVDGKMVAFYHGIGEADLDAEWDGAATWNREHVWPNSRGAGKSGAGSDPHVIRPTRVSDNSSRGNKFYGPASSNQYDPASLGYEPARGEASRIIMYAVVRWGASEGLSLSNNPADDSDKKTMGTLSYLLDWNNSYEVTRMEKLRQAYLDVGDGDDARNSTKDYGRNPFIDHPSYANYIWDENGLRTTPYGGGSGGGDTPTSSEPTSSVEPTWTHKEVTSLDGLDGKKLAIVTVDPDATSTYYALSSSPKKEEYPWYLSGDVVTMGDGQINGNPEMFTFNAQSDGTYTIANEDGTLLNNYISGTHYSICMGDPSEYDTTSTAWALSSASGDGFVFKGASNVYLEYYKSSWCGYKNAPANPIYLFEAI